jgi:pSer/pThr/pTyr-binding forkhead associated (FHA) protein
MQLVGNRGKAKGRFIQIKGPRLLIGRASECQLRPVSDEVSPRHAELRIVSGRAVIADLGSDIGTRVNGRALTGPAFLRTGDRIEIGHLSLTALLDEPRPSKRPRRPNGPGEDEIASWLDDEEEPDAAEAAPPQPRLAAGTAPAHRPRGGAVSDVDTVRLLEAMTIRSE